MNKDILVQLDAINAEIRASIFGDSPKELYDPITYIMQLGGKRMRPLLVILSYELYRDDATLIIKLATAVEVFHNFTLMHDDIMDHAPIRRGKPTVHEKWNENIAILSGDVMLLRVYDILMQVPDQKFKYVVKKFNQCAAEVCEGQQLDMNFETKEQVRVDDYLNMIRLKTAALLGFSMEFGAILANAPPAHQELLRVFGTNIGIGFQLMDDLLDVYADQSKFGKQVGGDIIANKKTYLLIMALQNAAGDTKMALDDWLNKKEFDKHEKVKEVIAIYDQLNIRSITEKKLHEYFQQGFDALERLDIPAERKLQLIEFTKYLINREK